MNKERTVGPRIVPPKFSPFRSLYPIYEGEELLAFLGIKNGWARSWFLYPLRDADGAALQFWGYKPDTAQGRIVSSKEGALSAIETLRRHFKTNTELSAAKQTAQQAETLAAQEYLKSIEEDLKKVTAQVDALKLAIGYAENAARAVDEYATSDTVDALRGLLGQITAQQGQLTLQMDRQRLFVEERTTQVGSSG